MIRLWVIWSFLLFSSPAQACPLVENPGLLLITSSDDMPELVQGCIETGVDMSAPLSNGIVPYLELVAAPNSLEAIQLLVTAGADPNAKGRFRGTAVGNAIADNREARGESELLSFVSFMVDAGADIDLPDRFGMSPLATAARDENIELLTLLIGLGANPNGIDRENGIPLVATFTDQCRPEVGVLLIAAGATLNGRPFFDAAMQEAREHCETVESGPDFIAQLETLRQ